MYVFRRAFYRGRDIAENKVNDLSYVSEVVSEVESEEDEISSEEGE